MGKLLRQQNDFCVGNDCGLLRKRVLKAMQYWTFLVKDDGRWIVNADHKLYYFGFVRFAE